MGLLTPEVDWVALSQAVNAVMFMIHLLTSMKFSIELPIIIRIDNMEAICMMNNITIPSCINHVETRYKYVNEYEEDGLVKKFLLSLLKMIATFSPKS